MYGCRSPAECARGMTARPGSARTGCTAWPRRQRTGLRDTSRIRGRAANINVNAIAPIAYTVAAMHATTGRVADPTGRLRWIREKCTPERAAPVAAYLVHEDCAVTGEVRRAAGGRVARIFVAETPGYEAEDLQLEDVREHIDQIRDEKDYTVPASSGVG